MMILVEIVVVVVGIVHRVGSSIVMKDTTQIQTAVEHSIIVVTTIVRVSIGSAKTTNFRSTHEGFLFG